MEFLKSLFVLDTYRGWLEAAKTKAPSFLQAYLDYCIKNPALFLLTAGLLLAILITLIVVICVSIRVSKKRKQIQTEKIVEEVHAPETVDEPQETQEIEGTQEIEETQEAEQPQEPALEEEKIVEEKPAETPVAEEEPIQTPVEEETSANQIEKTPRYKGKWSVYHLFTDAPGDSEETFYFELRASNGEKLLASEEYTSYNGALRGIETYKLNIARGNFKIAPSKKGDYIFKLLSGKNTLLCTGENYLNRASCENAIESTKRFAETAVLDKKLHEQLIKAPVEDDGAILPLPDGHNGKWVIESTKGAEGETLFYFVLYANNGEKLLTSEEYTTYVGAVNGISTHKKNIQAGNFKITLTKRGDYIYKLLNGNGQLLCLGEHYKTKRRCQNAVESVKRFALHSPMLTDASHTK